MKVIQAQEPKNADTHWESELIRRVGQGSQQAFTELVSLYQKGIFKLAYGFFQDRDDAMEIVQETFIRVYEKLDAFDRKQGKTAFKNWVYRIAYNLCIDYFRKFKKKKAEPGDIYHFEEQMKTESTNPADILEKQHFRQTLKKSVMQLSKRQKKIFILRHYSGLKHQEISEILDISVSSVKSQYCKAVQNLEKRLVRLEGVS